LLYFVPVDLALFMDRHTVTRFRLLGRLSFSCAASKELGIGNYVKAKHYKIRTVCIESAGAKSI
jgi:hypothetical protein